MIAADCGPGETHNAAGCAGMGAVRAADNAAGMARLGPRIARVWRGYCTLEQSQLLCLRSTARITPQVWRGYCTGRRRRKQNEAESSVCPC